MPLFTTPLQYRIHFSPSSFRYTVSCETPLRVCDFINNNHREIEEIHAERDLEPDLIVVLDTSFECPLTDAYDITPTIGVSTSEYVELSYSGFAKLKLTTVGPDVLTVHPNLGDTAPTLQLNTGLMALRHGAIKTRRVILHASALETKDRGLIFLGDTRTGKSTFTIMASLESSRLLSDDLVLVEYDENQEVPTAYAARKDFTLRSDIAESCFNLPTDGMEKIKTVEGTKYLLTRESNLVNTVSSVTLNHIFFCTEISKKNETVIEKLNSANYYSLLLQNFFPMFGENFRIFKEEQKLTKELIIVLHKNCTGHSISMGRDILDNPALAMKNLIDQLSKL